MKKIILAVVCLVMIFSAFSQDNQRPTKSRFWKSKLSSFQLKPGDILVYKVEDTAGSYDLIVYVKNYGSSIMFDYDVPTKGMRAGVNIDAAAVNSSTQYSGIIGGAGSEKNQTLWLSKKNYLDIASAGITTMSFGNDEQDFIRGNVGTLGINYKGKSKIITLFNVSNEEGEKTKLGVLTDEKNPLLVTINSGVRMTLKEVR